MAKHIQLTIADPCHEDLDKMTDSEKGKFCGSCQKQVIDFTGMTDTQLAVFFKKKSNGSVCGRFYDDQLDRGIPVPRKRIPWVKYFFQFTLPLFLTTLRAKAQGEVKVKTIQTETCGLAKGYFKQLEDKERLENLMRLATDQGILIKGKIINEEGKPVPYASIEKDLDGTAADSTGAFSLVIAPDPIGVKLRISSVGYRTKELAISKEELKEEITIILRMTGELEPVIVESSGWTKGRTIVNGTMSVINSCTWRGFSKQSQSPNSISKFKLYANPARASSNIFIDPGKTEAGRYVIQLLHISGQLIKQQESKIEKGMGAISFSVPAIPSGTYLVALLNKKTGKKTSEKLIVQ